MTSHDHVPKPPNDLRMVVLCLLEACALHVKGRPLTLTPGVSLPSLSHIPREAPTGLLHRADNAKLLAPVSDGITA